MLAAAGLDLFFVDTEHTITDYREIQNICRAARGAGIVPMVRVTQNEPFLISRALDCGAMGIVVPRVHSPAEARAAVEAMKFTPQGRRGFGFRGAIHDYKPASLAEELASANSETMAVLQMESREAIESNRSTVSQFIARNSFVADTSYISDQIAQQHEVCDQAPLQRVVEELLIPYRVEDASDTQSMLGLLLQLANAIERDARESVRIYRMRPKFTSGSRSVDAAGSLGSTRRLFQGPTRAGAGSRYSYPGDIEFRDSKRVSIQLHSVNLAKPDGSVVSSVPIIAVWIPARMELPWLTQRQPGQK
jgi:hypothetical protein